MNNEIRIVIGSWGSYNECNERALGSKWITLNDYNDYSEIEEELIKEGFELEGIDEELFIQDYEGIDGFNGDNMHPETLFEICQKAGILEDNHLYQKARALIEVNGWDDFECRVVDKEKNWDDDIYFYPGMTEEEVVEERVYEEFEGLMNKAGWLKHYIEIDYKAIARDSDELHEVEDGVIEIW